jgi:hypothetical protein
LSTSGHDEKWKPLVPLVAQNPGISGGIRTPQGQAAVTKLIRRRAMDAERVRQPDAVAPEVAQAPSQMDLIKVELAQDLTDLDDIFDADGYEEIARSERLPGRSVTSLMNRVQRNLYVLAPFLTPDNLQEIADIVASVYGKARALILRIVGVDNARMMLAAQEGFGTAERQFFMIASKVEKLYQYCQALLTVASNGDFKARQLANTAFIKEFFGKAEASGVERRVNALYRAFFEEELPERERAAVERAADVEAARLQRQQMEAAAAAAVPAGAAGAEEEEEGEGYKRPKKSYKKATFKVKVGK